MKRKEQVNETIAVGLPDTTDAPKRGQGVGAGTPALSCPPSPAGAQRENRNSGYLGAQRGSLKWKKVLPAP